MKNMQTFYRWLTTGSQQENMYREQLVGLTRTDLSKILTAAGFWDWSIWGSPGGPETK
jgi:hypothetical protein